VALRKEPATSFLIVAIQASCLDQSLHFMPLVTLAPQGSCEHRALRQPNRTNGPIDKSGLCNAGAILVDGRWSKIASVGLEITRLLMIALD
jgi:hypothetical protein